MSMALTTRPIGLGHGVDKDAIGCAALFGGAWNIGRIYERRGLSAGVRSILRPEKDYAAEGARLIKPWASVEPADRLPRQIGMASVMPWAG